MNTPNIQLTSQTLTGLTSGQRAWFWFCLETERVQTPLLLTPLAKDPGMTDLIDLVDAMHVPYGLEACVGLVHLDDLGRLNFGSPDAAAHMLPVLADWASANVGEYPALSRLSGARLIRYNESEGLLLSSWEDPSLWASLRRPLLPGSLSEAAQTLDGLKTGDAAWFWVTRSGPGGIPWLALHRQDADPDGKAFSEQSTNLTLRSKGPVIPVKGICRRLTSGTLVFVSQEGTQRAATALSALATRPSFRNLNGATVLRKSQTGFNQGARVTRRDISRQAGLLEAIAPQETLLFWMTASDKDGLPALVLDTDLEGLKAAARTVGGSGPTARGRLQVSKKGRVRLQARVAYPDMLQTLATWIATYAEGYPSLQKLIQAHALIKDDAGQINKMDGTSWDALFEGGR